MKKERQNYKFQTIGKEKIYQSAEIPLCKRIENNRKKRNCFCKKGI